MRDIRTKERAVAYVLYVLRQPLVFMTSDRAEAERVASEFGVTAVELLAAAHKRARDT